MVSTRTTYILWLTLGWLGIHHLYLGRLYQALVWFATFGGGCGVGWVRDAWRIPTYVQWCNPDKQLRKKYAKRAAGKEKPEYSKIRSMGMTMMGFLTSKVLSCLVPDFREMYTTDPVTYYALYCVYLALGIFGNALGIYIVANIGELKCSFYRILIVSACIVPIFLDITSTLGSSISTWIITSTGLKWRSPPPDEDKQGRGIYKKFCINFSVYVVICLLWLLLTFVAFYFNGTMAIEGKTKTGKQIVDDVYNSEAWHKIYDSFNELYTVYNQTGFWPIWRGLTAQITFIDKIKAYWLLGIYPGTNSEDISKRCRKLLAENHPDRFRIPQERKEAEARYVEINHACSQFLESRSRKLHDDAEL